MDIALTALLAGNADRRWARLGRALAGFLIVAAPMVAAMFISVGHPCSGDVGRFTYLKHVNGMPWPQWQGGRGAQRRARPPAAAVP